MSQAISASKRPASGASGSSATSDGYDLAEEAVAFGRDAAADLGLDNLQFERRDLNSFDEAADPAAFDLVTTFDAIHDQAKPLEVLIGIRKPLKPGGVYLAQDIRGSSHHHLDREHPMGAFLLRGVHDALYDRLACPAAKRLDGGTHRVAPLAQLLRHVAWQFDYVGVDSLSAAPVRAEQDASG